MATTQADIDVEVLAILNLPSSESIYGSTLRESFANQAQDEIARMRHWDFLKKKAWHTTAKDTAITTALTTASTTIDLTNVTGWVTAVSNNANAVIIEDDVIDFTSLATLTLSGVTNIDIAHASGTKAVQLYGTPSDMQDILEIKVNNVVYNRIDDFGSDTEPTHWYKIVFGTNSREYIMIAPQSGSERLLVKYTKEAPTMTSSQDATIPDKFAKKLIARLAAAKLLITRGDDEDSLGSRILAEANQGI